MSVNIWFFLAAVVIAIIIAIIAEILQRKQRRRDMIEYERSCYKNKINKRKDSLDSCDSFKTAYDYMDSKIQKQETISDSEIKTANIHKLKIIFNDLKSMNDTNRNDYDILCKMVKVYHRLSILSDSAAEQENFADKGIKMCKNALTSAPEKSEIHKCLALLFGIKAQFESGSVAERVKNGSLFKKHLDKAVEINQKDHELNHMLGRFNFDITSLNWFQRSIAQKLFDGNLNVSMEKALECFLQADKYCDHPWKENRLFIAKCYFNIHQISEGKKWLKAAYAVVNDVSDRNIDSEISTLLKKYR